MVGMHSTVLFAARRLLAFAAIGVVVAACSPAPAPATSVPTIPPEMTPATVVPSPTPIARATLPPTWTPAPPSTDIPTVYAPTPDLTATAIVLQPTNEICNGFGEDTNLNQPSFTFGESPIVYWLPLDGAQTYDIRLYDAADDRTLFALQTGTTSQAFDADLFQFDGSYYWLVRPISPEGVSLCPGAGAILYPVVR